MFLLESNRLRVEIVEPGEAPNNGFRFDRAGFISEVTLDGATHFCANEPKNLSHPSSGGRGLCCEYNADYSGEVEDGEYFPKFGVGLIRRAGPYHFYGRYADIEPFPVSISHDKEWATFVTEPISCLGYALKATKEIEVSGTTVRLKTTLENVGEKEIVTKEYCHNFLSIDGMAISPDYSVDFPLMIHLEQGPLENHYPTPCNLYVEGTKVKFERTETAVSMTDLPLWPKMREPFTWKLSHAGAKASVEGVDFIQPSGVRLWTVDHIVSPEIFQMVSVKQGETVSWKRAWTFEARE